MFCFSPRLHHIDTVDTVCTVCIIVSCTTRCPASPHSLTRHSQIVCDIYIHQDTPQTQRIYILIVQALSYGYTIIQRNCHTFSMNSLKTKMFSSNRQLNMQKIQNEPGTRLHSVEVPTCALCTHCPYTVWPT